MVEIQAMGFKSRRQFLILAAGAGTGVLAFQGLRRRGPGLDATAASKRSVSAPASLQKAEASTWALGSDVSIMVFHAEREQAEAAVRASFNALRHVEGLMSLYRPDSQICRLNRDGVLDDPHPDLIAVLKTAREWSQRTRGAFDVTVQPLWGLYSSCQRTGQLPDAGAIKKARALVDWRAIDVSPERVRLGDKGMAVTLNGIAQGFGADRVLAVLRESGVHHALINTGEVGALGAKPKEGKPWRVGIRHPRDEDSFIEIARLEDRCLATSGDYATSFSPDRNHHHIFDPSTGRSPEAFSAVTVLAKSATEADALSTSLMVLARERGEELAQRIPGAEALFVRKDGTTHATKGFPLKRNA
jgi:thiamine biosynthesis lipoprotein